MFGCFDRDDIDMPIGQVVVKLIYEGNCKSDPKSDESDLSMKAFV